MKKCPMCGSAATDDASICFDCLYSFDLMSCVAMMPAATEEEQQCEPVADIALIEELAGGAQPSDFDVVVEDQEFGQRVFPLDSGSLHIGRLPTNDIVLNDRTVSRRHLHIFFEKGSVWLEDFGSPNPALLNGAAVVGRVPFRIGDALRVRSADVRLVDHGRV